INYNVFSLYYLLLIKKEIENELAIEYKKVKCIFYFILFFKYFYKSQFLFLDYNDKLYYFNMEY
ncbi:hypothetical protein DO002_03120, partial [Campylobacter lari]|nr:hypothetical protein [Campylobacter lari]